MNKKKKEIEELNGSQKGVLDLAIAQINKDEQNKLAIGYFNKLPHLDVEVVPTGSISLDLALGVGGIPRGRVIEIFGPESSGKSTLCLHIIANAQKLGLTAAFIDMEHVFDPGYASRIGVSMDKLLFSQPDSGSEAIRTVAKLASTGAVGVIVLDSVASMATEEELEKEITDSNIGHQARLMSQALRILTPTISKSNTTIIFTNQIRMKIGIMFGNPETTPGGNALKFYATQRLDIRRKSPVKDGEVVIGAETRVKVVKNKVAPPFKEAHFKIIYGQGIDSIMDIIACAVNAGIIRIAGSWYSYGEEKIGQGEMSVVAYLKEHPDTLKSIEDKLKTTL
jgi:recombination protein RecA